MSYIKTSYGNIDLYTMMIAQADSAGVTEGYGILSASIDEIRFWKYERT